MSLKILTVCEHGNVRSVGLAYILKIVYGHDALACGLRETQKETFEMLFKWADTVILTDANLYGDLIKKIGISQEGPPGKVQILDVGKDVWFDAFHHGLQHKLLKGLKTLKL